MKRFSAPWGRALVWMSVLSSAILIVAILLIVMAAHTILFSLFRVTGVMLLALVLGTVLFIIRGYTVTPDAILVHRLLWDTRLSRERLISVTSEPKAMKGSIKVCGNGGLFSFTGWFWSKRLGRFHAYVTDLNRTVVLRWEKRTAVLSPGDPEGFVRELME